MNTQQFLSEELHNIHQQFKSHNQNESAQTLEFNFQGLDLCELLNHVHCEKIFFFKSKYENFYYLGLGQAKTIKAINLASHLLENPNHLLIATFLFEENPNASEFVLPEWTFVSRNDETKLSIIPNTDNKFTSPKLFFDLDFDLKNLGPISSSWLSYEELPEHDQWTESINKCLTLFDDGELKKIVLSRKKIFDFNEALEPIAFFKALLEKNNNAKSSYAIFHQISFYKAFISLTPEKLFSITDNLFESISLAASAPRGATSEEDLAFENTLIKNDKLNHEHLLVTNEIVKRLKTISDSITLSEIQTMKLPYIQHRSLPISATLSKNTTALDLISLLHPTPAIGGLPWNKAKSVILELEPYLRKSYAAPIGLMGAKFSELAVGIRSALIEGSKITLFGGAGIVKGSIAEEEWIETGLKMNPFLKVVNNE